MNSWAASLSPQSRVGGLSDHKHIKARARGNRRSSPGAGPSAGVGGWGGGVPAAHASDTLHTACLWGEFSGCGQRGGGRSEKKGSGRSSRRRGREKRPRAPDGRIQRRGGVGTAREFGLEVQIRVRGNVRKFESESAAERVWECTLPNICEASVCVWWSSR